MMEINDIFHSDPFNRVDMVEAINIAPGIPTRIGSMGLFGQARGTLTPDIAVKVNKKNHLLIQTAARGSDPEFNSTDPKEIKLVRAPHLPQKDAIMADELIRAYHADSLEVEVNDKLQDMRTNHDLTHEWHMLGAIRGQVLDANGTDVVYDWYKIFDLTRKVFLFTTDVYALCEDIKRWVSMSLGFSVTGGIHVFVEAEGFRKITRDTQVLADYNRLDLSGHARKNHAFNSAELYGVTFEEYTGYFDDTTPFVPANRGIGFPTGAGIFRRYNAPAPQTSAINQRGLPFYVTRKILDHEAGIEMKTNTNPLFMNTRPEASFEIEFA